MSDVAKLTSVPRPTVSDAAKAESVRLLKHVLQMAEAGAIQELFIVWKAADDSWSSDHSGSAVFPEMIGRVEIAKQEAITKYLGRFKEED